MTAVKVYLEVSAEDFEDMVSEDVPKYVFPTAKERGEGQVVYYLSRAFFISEDGVFKVVMTSEEMEPEKIPEKLKEYREEGYIVLRSPPTIL